MTTVQKFLAARTIEELEQQVGTHLADSWRKVGRAFTAKPGVLGWGQHRQLIEKDVAYESPVSFFLQDDLAETA